MKTHFQHRHSQRGSLLIVAMIFSAIIGVSLVTYIHLGRTALTISNRALYNNAAVNLAEQGIEEAMYSVNRKISDSTYNWASSGWTIVGSDAQREWADVALSQNATAKYRVYVYNYLGVAAPKVVSRATVTLGNGGAPIEKWIEVTLNKTSKFANGLVARNSVTFNGNNASVDSWNSEKNPDGTLRSSPVAYDTAYRRDNGSVGSIAVSSDAVLVKNADVWGYVSNNSNDPLHPPEEFVGTTGSILGATSPTGSNVDPARTSTTFSAAVGPVTSPATAPLANLASINGVLTLPRSTDTIPNGTDEYAGYYVYEATNINIGSGDLLTINGKVVLKLAGNVDVGGGDGVVKITSTGYLSIYTPGNVSMSGKGVANGEDGSDTGSDVDQTSELGQPKQFQIWGTKTSGVQSMDFTGNGLFSGIIYAPQGDVKIAGNGAINGSIVANDITLSGNAQFHYDESLADLNGNSPFRVSKWKELTLAADRTTYSPVLSW